MNRYTFRSEFGDYSFSDKQIEANTYLNKREKEIMHGLAAGQSQPTTYRENIPSMPSARSYSYEMENTNSRRTLTKEPVDFDMWVNWRDQRWYETDKQFLARKVKEYRKLHTVKTKEVKRENINVERSTFGDGTEITKWDKQTRLFY